MSLAATIMHAMPILRIRGKGIELVEHVDSYVFQQEKESDLKSSEILEGACHNILDHENFDKEKSVETRAGDLVKHGGSGTIAKDEQDTSDVRLSSHATLSFKAKANSFIASLNDQENIVTNSSRF